MPACLNLSDGLGLQRLSKEVSQWPKDRIERIQNKGVAPWKELYVLTGPSGGRCDYFCFYKWLQGSEIKWPIRIPTAIGQRVEIKFKFVVFWSQSLFCDTTCFSRLIGSPETLWVQTAFSYVHIRKLTCRVKPRLAKRLSEFANLIFWVAEGFLESF